MKSISIITLKISPKALSEKSSPFNKSKKLSGIQNLKIFPSPLIIINVLEFFLNTT
jgi:hypothetical protein